MKVYKYRYGSKRDLESLQKDYFYAPHPSKLNDPCENLFETKDVQQVLKKMDSFSSISINGVQDSFSELFENIRGKIGIYSLSKTVLDELLWAYYADSHTGFCIEYDLEKLGELIKFAGSFDVDYQDIVPQITFNKLVGEEDNRLTELLKLTSGTKSKKWQHEDEIRIVMDDFGKVEYDFRAVKSIYFGLRMPKTKDYNMNISTEVPVWIQKVSQDDVMFALKGRNIKYYQVVLKPNSYEFEYVEVEDLYKDAFKYKVGVKFLDKAFIDYNGYGWDVEFSYFDKVVEIIRREPYFHKINSIHVSKERSIANNEPIIFAGFLKAENDFHQIKKYYTLKQINDFYQNLNL